MGLSSSGLTATDRAATPPPPFAFQVADHKDLIATVSTEATQEAALEGMLDSVSVPARVWL